MIPRLGKRAVERLAHGFPVLALTGPRQSGKTTLAREMFSDKPYVSLENPATREFAEQDPARFFAQFEAQGAVIDEVQRLPQLLSWLQGIVDERGRMGDFVITGSSQLELLAGITQSLAGRVGRVELLPLSWQELAEHGGQAAEQDLNELLLRGGYPALYSEARQIEPALWHSNYLATYVERDVRALLQIRDLSQFQRFIKLCAARSGQVLNASALGADAGIDAKTVRHWLSVLEASYLVKLISPYYVNFGKRVTKAPKLYFLDTGLLCYLLGIRDAQMLSIHAARGAIFETWVISEHLKRNYNQASGDPFYFWRSTEANEIDLLEETPQGIVLTEVKSGSTIASDWFKPLKHFPAKAAQKNLIYGGNETYVREGVWVRGWRGCGMLELA